MRLLICLISLVIVQTVAVQKAKATSIDWSGGYRIEYNEIDRPTLGSDDNKKRKAYALNYLYLNPKIVASDGINIVGRFDIFSNNLNAYKNSQLGSVFGKGLSDGAPASNGTNVNSENQDASLLRVSQLYLTVNQENAMFLAGRAPLEFGLGITHNAGTNPFDHWYDNRDLVAYRFIVDNVSFMPVFAKVSQLDFGQGTITTDQIFVFEYDNKDNGAKAGLFYQIRNSSFGSNDATTLIPSIPGASSVTSSWSTKTVNLYFGRSWEAFQFKLEASFLTGDTGIVSTSNEAIKYNAYAIAGEVLFPAKDQDKWEIGAKFGTASGDNPTTTGTIEGYQMDRNYDVAMLLFNHRMGQRDFLTTNITHATDGVNGLNVGNSADDEAIGNAIYIAPSAKYLWTEKLDLKTTLIYAQLATAPTTSVDASKNLGTELDIELNYKPRERVIWSNQFGVLFPGDAWKDGASNFDNKINYGFSTKAAITF